MKNAQRGKYNNCIKILYFNIRRGKSSLNFQENYIILICFCRTLQWPLLEILEVSHGKSMTITQLVPRSYEVSTKSLKIGAKKSHSNAKIGTTEEISRVLRTKKNEREVATMIKEDEERTLQPFWGRYHDLDDEKRTPGQFWCYPLIPNCTLWA